MHANERIRRRTLTSYANQSLPRSGTLPQTRTSPQKANADEASGGLGDAANDKLPGGVRIVITWALRLARVFEVFPLRCPSCKQEMKIIAFINERNFSHPYIKSFEYTC